MVGRRPGGGAGGLDEEWFPRRRGGGRQEPEGGAVEGRTEETAAHGLRGRLSNKCVVCGWRFCHTA